MDVLKRMADNKTNSSLANKLRQKRFVLFRDVIQSLPRPLNILDVGGEMSFWEKMGFGGLDGVNVMILNLRKVTVRHENFSSMAGDARNMGQFGDKEFDVVFSNSVIEHVGGFREQMQMANEVRRIGERYWVQTPNRSFPVEPHFLFPFFQFYPEAAKVYLVQHRDMGWFKKTPDPEKAREIANSVRLVSKSEMHRLFPDGELLEERVYGLTKSFIVIHGFETRESPQFAASLSASGLKS